MLRSLAVLFGTAVLLLPAPASGELLHESTWAAVKPAGLTSEDLVRPLGKTRWRLEALPTERRWVRSIEIGPDGTTLVRGDRAELDGRHHPQQASRFVDPSGGDGALRWLLPHRDPRLIETAPGTPVVVDRLQGAGTEHLWVRVRRAGAGWVHLPSGPREVVLQEALVFRRERDGRAWRSAQLVYRWVDPRAGIVAEAWGAPAGDGRSIGRLDGAGLVEQVTTGADPFVIYADELDPPILQRVTYGFDRGSNTSVPSLAPQSPANMGALVALGAWDFSGNNLSSFPGMSEIGSTVSTVSASETCNSTKCGFTLPGVKLGREDKNFSTPASADITINALLRENRATNVTLWLRAAVRHEGISGIGVDAESRICYVTEGATIRTPVPLFRFPHQDGAGWFFQNGDSWSSDSNPATPAADPFLCEKNVFFQGLTPCSCSLFCEQRIAKCNDASCGGGSVPFAGTQGTTVVATGPVTLPSGHTFNSAVLKQVAEFCVYGASSTCPVNNPVQPVRTALWLWEVPLLGTVVRLQSVPLACQVEGLSSLDETDIKFGLFPPRTIAVGSVTETSVELTWDPGLDTHRIGVPGGPSYRVYWDTDSGANSPYAFDSIDQAGQATINGTSAVIGGLTPGVEYFFSVTSRSQYANPATGTPVVYESLLYPLQVAGPAGSVPAEVSATPGGACAPTAEVEGVTLAKVPAGIEICWDPVVDPCVEGYRIFGASSPESASNFSVLVPDTGLVTCHSFDPAAGYFLVAGQGSGGTGPLGHFGQ